MSNSRVFVILISLFAAACSRSPVTSTNVNAPEPPQIASVDVVEATPSTTSLTRGEATDAVVPIKITHGYHVNANPPSYPYLKPLEVQVQNAGGVSVEFITYPDPLKRKFSFAENPLAVYEGETTVKVRLKADKTATPGQHNLSATLRVQACDDRVCYAPGEENLILPVSVK